MYNWITPQLKNKVRKVFEPRYGRVLTEDEVVEIAVNLVGYIELTNSIKGNEV